ncbi:hypothetical protein NM688_g6514 [Phlebia brevispora]|uniref:Uncharacterized protein n=1 Tax=Phlebia brevispora TaxID=194682 RepID=A0ACC1SF72_9APHY|nr:hypothetical protein NM688_g6514 [Phlebia brevispora]
MGTAYIFTLQPTFTQGLVLGQLSILCLLVVVLKYLFFDSPSDRPYKSFSYQPRILTEEEDISVRKLKADAAKVGAVSNAEESADWLNILLHQVLDAYRTKLRDDLPGPEGDEVARKRVEAFANKIRPPGFLDPIKVHSVDLGLSAPRLSRARPRTASTPHIEPQLEVDMHYTDTLSISISTSVLFNYPFIAFARLPISLTISLSLFSSTILLTPPQTHTPHPTITISLPSPQSEFILDLKTTSLMGSRAKLADVPKLHELITHQIRRVIAEKGTWKVVLPGLASVQEVKEDVQKQMTQDWSLPDIAILLWLAGVFVNPICIALVMLVRAFHLVSLCFVLGAAADSNDWVNVDYVKQAASKPNPDTAAAISNIASKADSTAQKGPWTIINKNINPPSGDARDYLSWAPYHWPDCNWCSKGTSHFANPNATDPNDDPDDPGDDPEDGSGGDSGDNSPLENGGVDDPESENIAARDTSQRFSSHFKGSPFSTHHRMKRVHRPRRITFDTPPLLLAGRQEDGSTPSTTQDLDGWFVPSDAIPSIPISVPTQPPSVAFPQPPANNPLQPTTTANRVVGTGAPAQAPAKTGGGSKCTPSPTKSLAPSATWTTCPYVVRDGKVNPDTDTLVGPDAVQNMSQSVLYNALAYALQKTSKYSQNVAKFIDTFFLSSTTGMHPNVNFGQMVRGPGKEHQVGTFTGILDLRGMPRLDFCQGASDE